VYYFGIVIDIAIIIVSMAFTESGLVIPVGVMFCSLGLALPSLGRYVKTYEMPRARPHRSRKMHGRCRRIEEAYRGD
jgi:hypothetical protein